MKRKSGVLFATTGGVALLGLAAGYWHFGSPAMAPTENVALASTAPSAPGPLGDAMPSASQAPVAAPADPLTVAAEGLAPSFDVIRVEPDGATLIAGRMAPDTALRVMDGDRLVAEGRSNAQGEFALTLEQNLAIGDHELRLVAGEGAEQTLSEQRAVISVPMPGRESELLVMLESPDSPSRLIAAPRAAPDAGAPPAQIAAATGDAPLAPESTGAKTARVAAADANAPSIGAVEIEGDRLFVAGSARKGDKVRLYLNDVFVAEAPVGDKREFLAAARHDVPVGEHVVRADVLNEAGAVVARAEVPFSRPDGERVAAVAASPALPGMSAAEKLDPSLAREAEGADGALQPVDGRVIIRKGDTLWRISRDSYGAGSRYTVIYLANGDQIRNPDLIYPGQIFRMPASDQQAGG